MPITCPPCQHTHPNGNRCGSPALRGQQFCFYHHPARPRPSSPARAARASFYVPPITDAEEFQLALSEVIRRVADGSLDLERANFLFTALQVAKASLDSLNSGPSPFASPYPDADFADLSGLAARPAPPTTSTIS